MRSGRAGALYANEPAGVDAPSLYAATAAPRRDRRAHPREALGAARCDALVIGAGYTGLSAARRLASAGRTVLVVDAHRVGWGASGRNGGQVGVGFSADLSDLEAMVGLEASRALFSLSLDARALVKRFCADFTAAGVDCGFRSGVLYACAKASHVVQSRRSVDAMATRYGYDQARFLTRDAVRAAVRSAAYHGGALDLGSGHLHPLNFAIGLADAAEAAGVVICERTEATAIDVEGAGPARVRLQAPDGAPVDLQAGAVVLAVNGFAQGLHRGAAARAAPINNYMAATAPLGPARAAELIRDGWAVADTNFVVNYFRLDAQTRLIFGGGESYGARYPKDLAAVVRPRLLRVFPHLSDLSLDYAWGGTLAITPTRLPWLARLSPRLWTAGGYSGHGVALATYSGEVLADAILGAPARLERLAALPVPRFPGGARLQRPLLALAMFWFALRDRL